MHCKLDIELSIIKKAIEAGTTKNIKPFGIKSLLVNKKDFKAEGQTFKIAEEKSKQLNERFGDELTSIKQVTDGHEIVISPSEALIDDYYDGYIKTIGKEEQVDIGIDRFGDSKPVFSVVTSSFDKMDKLFPVDDVVSNYEIINLIKNNGTPAEKELVEIFSPYIDETAPVEFTDVLSDERANGQLSYSKGGTTNIKIKNAASGKTSIYLHELTHEITLRQIDQFYKDKSKLNKEQIEAIENLAKVFIYTKNKFKDDKSYGFTKLPEFISEAFSNKEFQDKLNDVDYRNTSIFSKILNYLGQLLGVKQGTALSETLNETIRLVNNTTNIQELGDVDSTVFSKKEKKEFVKPTFEKQYVFFKRRLNLLKKELDRIPKATDEYSIKEAELDREIDRFNKATEEQDREEYVNMALDYLQWVEDLTNRLPENPDKYVLQELTDAFEILETFDRFDKDVVGIVMDLESRLMPYIFKHNLKTINNYNTSGKNITLEDVDNQVKDIRWSSKNFGSLLDLANYIGRTIGSVIKNAQNTASTKNKMVEALVQKEVDDLNDYAKANNLSLEDVYEIFIQDRNNTLVLTQRYTSKGVENPNYQKIQSTPELLKFYNFYQKMLVTAQGNLPYKVGKFYILNKAKSDLKSDIKRIIPVEDMLFDNFVSNEDLIADMIPDMFRANTPSDKKSRDLGSGLLEFVAYANNHNALASALPEVRLLQKQLKYKQNTDGSLMERQFVNPSNPQTKVNAEDSNVYKMVKTIIDMQLKGKMKVDNTTPIKLSSIKDADGEIVGYKQIHVEDIIDKGLQYNSMLRIGFAPVTALANVIFGDISNFIESVGSRFFTVKQMNQATNIFFKQINYTSTDKDSNLYKWLEKLNPLQELADYDIGANLIANKRKLSKEKTLELMYSMQKKGELYLQTRTMIAMLIHDGYINDKGENLKKGDEISNDEALKLSDKIQRINQQIHGRYSQREAAALQQSVWYRMIIQFKKWLPTAVEQRFGDRKYDNRLGVEIEGRYKTLANLFFTKEALGNFNKMLKGELSELEMYNMRKTLVEGILIAATMLMYATLRGGDDDKEDRKKALIKASLTLLNRASGDLVFFYSPNQLLHTATNAVPLAKTAKDILTVINNVPHAFYDEDSQYKTGSRKGQNKFYTKLGNVVVGVKPIQDIRRLLNEQMLEELN